MKLSGHQPNYLPYPGLIGKIMISDKFIYVTKVQFDKKSWQNRNKIKTNNGDMWLTVPTLTKGKFEQKICDVKINNDLNWKRKHLNSLKINYKDAKYFNTYISFFEELYLKDWEYLCDLDIVIMNFVLDELNVKTEILYDNNYEFFGNKTNFLINMCKKTNCTTYISNKGSEDYVNIECFTENKLNHIFVNYIGEEYEQCFGNFINNLSIVDMLFNCGPNKTRNILDNINNYQISELNKKIH